jgi:hypothetical protein
MRVLSHPFRLDSNGQAVTVQQGSHRQAGELAGAVVSTIAGERGLAPLYGLRDPNGQGVDGGSVAAAIEMCEPDLDVTAVTVNYDAAGYTTVRVSVEWAEE